MKSQLEELKAYIRGKGNFNHPMEVMALIELSDKVEQLTAAVETLTANQLSDKVEQLTAAVEILTANQFKAKK